MGMNRILLPHDLIEVANKADDNNDLVKLPSQQVRLIAEVWFRDQEKIKYLESLLLRKE